MGNYGIIMRYEKLSSSTSSKSSGKPIWLRGRDSQDEPTINQTLSTPQHLTKNDQSEAEENTPIWLRGGRGEADKDKRELMNYDNSMATNDYSNEDDVDDEIESEVGDSDEFDFGVDSSDDEDESLGLDDQLPDEDLQMGDDEMSDDTGDSMDDEESMGAPDGDMGTDDEEEGDENFQGNIRSVRGANLVYKRGSEDGTFEELWIYNITKNRKRDQLIRTAIFAGTDIDPHTAESRDGSQEAEVSTLGNVQFLRISGLVN